MSLTLSPSVADVASEIKSASYLPESFITSYKNLATTEIPVGTDKSGTRTAIFFFLIFHRYLPFRFPALLLNPPQKPESFRVLQQLSLPPRLPFSPLRASEAKHRARQPLRRSQYRPRPSRRKQPVPLPENVLN